MNKKTKVIIGVLAVVLVIVTVFVVGQTGLLGGRFPKIFGHSYPMYSYKGKVVSGVTSPVTSVVVSDVSSGVASAVTSDGGTSYVTSWITSHVPSAVTSPVASAVTVPNAVSAKIDMDGLTVLTAKILESMAQKDYKADPSRFTLSQEEKQRIIDLYQ